MRLAFLGTPAFAVPVLDALAEAHEVALVVSRADRRRSRRGQLEPSPVKAAAQRLGIPTTERVRDVTTWEIELGVVVAFGRIVKEDVLRRVPMVNLHLSRLPRWRGAAPVQRAILAGDEETGICLMSLDEGLDTGPVHGCETLTIGADETADELTDRLTAVGIPLLLDHLERGLGEGARQSGEATYAEKITAADLRLSWNEPAVALHRQVRVGAAWCRFRDRRLGVITAGWDTGPSDGVPGEITRVDDGLAVATGGGRLILHEVKPEGRRGVPALDWANGARLLPGERLE
ncbi:MAG TPA: methionyl-tRNA formyltransferase [Acidimicrobiales bacterium]|nr:methionyl-tRNA formyltransferase [Acidimicrobiales bacterium]